MPRLGCCGLLSLAHLLGRTKLTCAGRTRFDRCRFCFQVQEAVDAKVKEFVDSKRKDVRSAPSVNDLPVCICLYAPLTVRCTIPGQLRGRRTARNFA